MSAAAVLKVGTAAAVLAWAGNSWSQAFSASPMSPPPAPGHAPVPNTKFLVMQAKVKAVRAEDDVASRSVVVQGGGLQVLGTVRGDLVVVPGPRSRP